MWWGGGGGFCARPCSLGRLIAAARAAPCDYLRSCQAAKQGAPAAPLTMRAATIHQVHTPPQVLRVPAHAEAGARAAQPPPLPGTAPHAGRPAAGARAAEVTDLDWTLENDRLAAAAADGSVCVWLVATGQLVRTCSLCCCGVPVLSARQSEYIAD